MAAQIISFINMKGGVGKTTLAVNVAYGLAWNHGKKVLVVDADPQFNATQYLLETDVYLAHHDNPSKSTLYEVFRPKTPGAVSTISGTSKGKNKSAMPLSECICRIATRQTGFLDLLPSSLKLVEMDYAPRGTERKLSNFLKERTAGYDYVIIDCPPTVSIFTQSAVLASSKYVVPLKPDPLSVIGLPLLERWLEDFTETNGLSIESVGLVFTMVKGVLPNTMRNVMEEIRENRGETVFEEVLSDSKDVAKSVEKRRPVFRSAPGSKTAVQIQKITDEFVTRTS